MTGLFLTIVYALWQLITGTPPINAYQPSMDFLFQWYLWTSALYLVIWIIAVVAAQLYGTYLGAQSGPGYAILAFLGIGATSIIGIVILLIQRGLLVAGSYFLTQALISASSEPVWDTTKLILGVILVILGLILGRSPSNSD